MLIETIIMHLTAQIINGFNLLNILFSIEQMRQETMYHEQTHTHSNHPQLGNILRILKAYSWSYH